MAAVVGGNTWALLPRCRGNLVAWHSWLDLYLLIKNGLHCPPAKHTIYTVLCCEGDKPEAPGPHVVVIIHDHGILYRPELLKVGAEHLLICCWSQPAHEDFSGASLAHLYTPCCTATIAATLATAVLTACALWGVSLRDGLLALHLQVRAAAAWRQRACSSPLRCTAGCLEARLTTGLN